jgi:glucose 1-dehydrogenase
MLVQQMAYEWGRHGIRVNCVSPGLTLSRSTEAALGNLKERERVGGEIPLRRIGNPEDVATVVAFVIGPGAGYITGENINVDGGLRHIGTERLLNDGSNKWAAHDAERMRPQGG